MTFLKISITQKGPIYFSNKVWTDLAPGHAQIFYGNWRWQGGGWVLGVWICMIWDAWFWFFTISYCILCCRNQLMVFMNSLETATRWCRARSRIIKCDLYGILWSLFHCEGWLDRTNHWPGFKRINWGCLTLFSSTHGGFAWLLLSTIVAQVWWWLGVNKKARHLWLISKCVFANIGDYSPGNQSQLSQMAIQDSIWF